MEFPFNEHIEDGYYIRTFSQDVDEHELVWHRDREDRIIIPLNENDWMIQMDNQLPELLNKEFFIPKGEYHRVIKGNGDLNLKIKKMED